MKSRLLPLDVLYMGESPHGSRSIGEPIIKRLKVYPAVRSIAMEYELAAAKRLLASESINTIIIDPFEVYPDDRNSLDYRNQVLQFILDLQASHPHIVFIFNTFQRDMERIRAFNERFKSFFGIGWPDINPLLRYYDFERDEEFSKQIDTMLDEILSECQEWHRTRYHYDAALSFAGEDRSFAEQLSLELKQHDLSVFYDLDFQSELLGANLVEELFKKYAYESRYCAMLISEAYRDKIWTKHERQAAQQRALLNRGIDYLLPIRIDDTVLPGLPSTIGYISASLGAKRIAALIADKVWFDPSKKKRIIVQPPNPHV